MAYPKDRHSRSGSPPGTDDLTLRQGWVVDTKEAEAVVDQLAYITVLVRVYQMDKAMAFFSRWRKNLVRSTRQKVILVT